MKRLELSWEILRKAVHLFAPPLIVFGYTILLSYFSERIAILAITAILLLLLEFESLRIEYRGRFLSMLDGLFRRHEKDTIAADVYCVISCIICFAAFDYWIAVLALFMMVFGDIFSSIFGMFLGKKILYKNKTYIGTFAGFAANILTAFVILPDHFFSIGLPMAFIASFTEVITNKLDDNLTVPLFAGFVGQILVYIIGVNLF